MYTLILSTFITLVILLLDLRSKSRQPAYRYLSIFFLIAGIGFFFQAMKAESVEYHRYIRAKSGEVTINVTDTTKNTKQKVKKEFIEKCFKKANYHFDEGCQCLKEAEDISLLWPNVPDFDKASFCLTTAVATVASGEPTYKLIAAAIAMGGQYAMIVMEEWQKFKTLLLRSKTHFEMEEHYRIMGKYEYDMYMIEKEESIKKKK